ncbi:MAG: hypothetical protein GY715_11910 [Planctomycetes bacterium]|nr:hypothetical protein [Planctomycetota bacterium]
MQRLFLTGVMLGVLTSCVGAGDRDEAVDSYERAASLAKARDFTDAFTALEGCMHAGYPTPSDVLCSDDFRPLLDDPRWRPRIYELLEASAREQSISMVGPDEPGEPMILTVRIVAGHREPPEAIEPPVRRAGVGVGLVHVNAVGYYQPWTKNESWNPRQFGFALTDETGTVVVRTIRPGYYAPEYEAPDEPAHVHYNVEQNGVLLRASEFFFEDDPRLAGDARREAEAQRAPIASIARDDEGVWRAEVTIPVRGLR